MTREQFKREIHRAVAMGVDAAFAQRAVLDLGQLADEISERVWRVVERRAALPAADESCASRQERRS